jgi:hypothetical protein
MNAPLWRNPAIIEGCGRRIGSITGLSWEYSLSVDTTHRTVKRIALVAATAIVALYVVGGGILSYIIYTQSFSRNDTDRASIFRP